MDANDLLNAGQEYAEQYAKYLLLLKNIRGLSDSPDQLPKSFKFLDGASEGALRFSFVGKRFEIYHETDLPKTALWSKIVIAQEIKGEFVNKGILRIDRVGNIKPDAAMAAQHTHENGRDVLLMLIDQGMSEVTSKGGGH